ncbi:MAG: hypothetical protein WBP22_02655 [Candidatus Saccharimonas sp.]
MNEKKPETVINEWCAFHLDETASRWPAGGGVHEGARVAPNGFIYAGDGIVAALTKAGYRIVSA